LYSTFCALVWNYGIQLLGNLVFGGSLYPLHFFTPRKLFTWTWFNAHPFVIWSAFYLGFKIYEEWMSQKQSTERAKMLAQSAQLETLRYQLNPHFLFNTLSSLRGLITKNQELAKDVVLKISEFLRYTLSAGKDNEVPLSQELQALRQYLDIEMIQYGDNLVVRFDIDPLAEDYPIPIFLLHPLVENAVKHGMKTTQLPLRLTLSAQIEDDNLRIELVNTGKWLDRQATASGLGTNTGLENVRKRLQYFYPNNHRFEIHHGEEAVHVTITITKQLVPSHVA
jgi:LytS/YehU family sensor histidine kinase